MGAHLDQCQVLQIEPEEVVSVGREERFKLMDGFIICFVFLEEKKKERPQMHTAGAFQTAHMHFPSRAFL